MTKMKPCSDDVITALDCLKQAFFVFRPDIGNPFCNSGGEYDGKVFRAHCFSWVEENQEWNFVWRDVKVEWYKYFGRATNINRDMRPEELKEMLKECLTELMDS